MKVHKYQVTVYDTGLDWFDSVTGTNRHSGKLQNRLFFPGYGVLGYKTLDEVEFFSNDPAAIAEAESVLKKDENDIGVGKYIGEFELPDKLVLQMVDNGRKLNDAKTFFKSNSKNLNDLLS